MFYYWFSGSHAPYRNRPLLVQGDWVAGVPLTKAKIHSNQVLFSAFDVRRTDNYILLIQGLNITVYICHKQTTLKLHDFYMKFGTQFSAQETDV